MAKKKVTASIKLHIGAGSANPSPPVGPALGQAGIKIMDFCNAFNSKTSDTEKGTPIPVVISVFEDRSFSFVVKTPTASYFIKKALNLKKGSAVPNKDKVGTITRSQLEAIAKEKMIDLNVVDINAAINIIAGTAKSMGVVVKD